MTTSLFSKKLLRQAILESLVKLNPRIQIKNPVMFITLIGAVVVTIILVTGSATAFNVQIAIWLWFTIIFANFSEALAEGRGKAQADSLKKARSTLR